MARESSSLRGSGIQVLRHTNDIQFMTGSNVVVINPEDISSALGVLQTQRVDVSTVITNLTSGILPARRQVMVYNRGPSDIFVGNSGVTAANGFILIANPAANQPITFDILGFGSIFAVTSTGTAEVRVMQIA